jgi:hypothetical protein
LLLFLLHGLSNPHGALAGEQTTVASTLQKKLIIVKLSRVGFNAESTSQTLYDNIVLDFSNLSIHCLRQTQSPARKWALDSSRRGLLSIDCMLPYLTTEVEGA